MFGFVLALPQHFTNKIKTANEVRIFIFETQFIILLKNEND